MKTLYININNEKIQSNEELEVLNYDLDSDFFFYLGEKIAKGCKVENENALITDFISQNYEDDYQQIISQWNELKGILFSEECKGKFEFTLPNGYIHWLRYNEKYNFVYDQKFSHGEQTVISVDIEEFFEDSIEDMQRKILRKLERDDLYLDIDEIIFNDDAVIRNSSIVRAILKKYSGIGFCNYKKYRLKSKNIIKDEDSLNLHDIENKITNNTISNYEMSIEERIEIANKFRYYCKIGRFFDGLAYIENYGSSGFIDEKGNTIVPCIYRHRESYVTSPYIFKDGVAVVKYENKYGFVDKTGKEVVPCIYNYISEFSEGVAFFSLSIGRSGIIDTTGKEIVPPIYGYHFDFHEGLAYVELNGKWGFIDKNGEVIIPFVYSAYIHSRFSEGLANVKLYGKHGFIDKTGKVIIPYIYDDAHWFSEGLAGVKLNGKWGFIDKKGKMVIPCVYDSFGGFSEGMATVEMNGKYGAVDKTGREIIPCVYGFIGPFENGISEVSLNGKYGLIDKTGKELTKIVYDFIDKSIGGLYVVRLNDKYGVLDKKGKSIVPCIANSDYNITIVESINIIILHLESNMDYFYDFNGNVILR